ncbi:MAG: ATP-binding cassette domain-containing protein [Candidatus Marinimicrobia bacterium]|jgi:ABC-2 type transport system ATP-binding protein|nr:ATP-binding cassette domain-containing protein [Candidatus Neomarinimicrobiota bacterium]MBT3617836.1 ATP-binding cassette domain-containing protein [Candidatus Neomarinimicrobiota bacterium]MBT3828193.1 ATP-binding cassette domain-containing protein [Candidatus Neomarinimicrobiota bacterium]MBT3997110.1 ATP-binding cassette domain-containing protein [Candidatus Neomarinimicrobiota bacterium]MBT4280576.1 ATP-binding cassette domain-containing protein [Candidatus Neomarinimicrobiota bacterium
MIKIQNIHKQYDKVTAVDHVSFSVETGDIFGLLGPNGAGKTTIIRMLMSIIEPDSGTIHLDGTPMLEVSRKLLGYLPEERGLYPNQKLLETLMYLGSLKGVPKDQLKQDTMAWLKRFDLAQNTHRKIQELSKGNQQKVQFIMALIQKPKFVILDEPFTGLDPLNQLLLKDIIEEQKQEGVTFIFSTHQMEQVERLCTNICLINRGKVLINGSLEDVRTKHSKDAVEVQFRGDLNGAGLSDFMDDPKVIGASLKGVLKKPPREFLKWLNPKVDIESFQIDKPSLEQIFIEEVRASS